MGRSVEWRCLRTAEPHGVRATAEISGLKRRGGTGTNPFSLSDTGVGEVSNVYLMMHLIDTARYCGICFPF